MSDKPRLGPTILVIGIVLIIIGLAFGLSEGSADYTDDEFDEMLDDGEFNRKYDEGDTFTSSGTVLDSPFQDDINTLIENGEIEGEELQEGDTVIITWKMMSIFDIAEMLDENDLEGELGSIAEGVNDAKDMMNALDMSEEDMEDMAEDDGTSLIIPWPVEVEKTHGTSVCCGLSIMGIIVFVIGIFVFMKDRKRENMQHAHAPAHYQYPQQQPYYQYPQQQPYYQHPQQQPYYQYPQQQPYYQYPQQQPYYQHPQQGHYQQPQQQPPRTHNDHAPKDTD